MVTFGLGVALAAASGGLVATLFPFTVLSGGTYQLKSFVVIVLAGLASQLARWSRAYCWDCWKAQSHPSSLSAGFP